MLPSSPIEILLAFRKNVLLSYAEYTNFLFLVNLSWIIRDVTPSNTTYILHKFKTAVFSAKTNSSYRAVIRM
jgi:hypothetical protein